MLGNRVIIESMLTTWIGFLISLAGILVISRKNLALAITSGAVILGLFTMEPGLVLDRIVFTLTDSSIMILAIAMGIIPMLGGTMKDSGQIDSLIDNLRISKRYLLALSSAMMGLLPMPGGALLSAPILERAGVGVADDIKATINNWFRHLLILVYPLSPALIASAKISNLDVYTAIIHLLPWFLIALILAYFFFLRQVHGFLSYRNKFSFSGLTIPLIIILSAPILDFSLKRIFSLGTLATLIGVLVAFSLSLVLCQKKLDLRVIAGRMKPWNFTFILIGMFIYLHIFQESNARNLIATLPLPPLTLSVTAGFLLGFVTGRVQLPASIILPVYLSTIDRITPSVFGLIYTGIFFGYITSPVHPCLVVTSEYFHVSIKDLIRKLLPPVMIIFITVFIISLVL